MPESISHEQANSASETIATTPLVHHVYAMQRSGHHAVMAWLQDCYEQAGLSTGHLNDVYHGHVPGLEVTDPGVQDILEASSSQHVTFVNYEDLGYRQRNEAPSYREVQARPDVISQDVIVLRDWYNMAASRLRSIDQAKRSGVGLQLHDLPWRQVTQAWEDHASHALTGVPTTLYYNQWFADRQYRCAAAAQFGLLNSDRSIDNVPVFGRGSSFDGMTYMTSGRKMSVLERWSQLSLGSHQLLIEISESSAALTGLNHQIFGFGLEKVKQSYMDCVRAE